MMKKALSATTKSMKTKARYQLALQKVKDDSGPRRKRGRRKTKRKEVRITTLKRMKIVLNFMQRRSYNIDRQNYQSDYYSPQV
jgi:hypothetical protein